jgi:glycosyltransferase involved in cell wall biosynthesis
VKILLTNSTDIYAGGEDYVLTLARYLGRRGHRVAVSALPGHLLLAKCQEAGLLSVPIDYRGMHRVFSVALELRRRVKALDIDVVHSNANYDRTCAAIACAFTRARHIAGVHSTHSIQHNITHRLRNRFGTDHFITDAEAGKEVLVREDHLPSWKITTVPIGIEDPDPEISLRSRAETRRALGASADTLVVGNVARLVPFKGHRVLLDAVAQVTRSFHDVLFPIVGDGELLQELQDQASRLGIVPYVRFLGFRDHLESIYPAFDVYCHSSLDMASEMFPIAILRSLAAGLPVVCTNVGGVAAMVEEGISGYLVRPDDPAALADALGRVLAGAELRVSMGRGSRRLFERGYHAAAMAERVEQVYLSLFPGRPSSGTHQ